ncbi:L,D-transpeptidase [Pseudaminobacter sp. 19-2017]|uniref:L,D-transpeptidase n=1 Tax=Pseudaminobacter soli (ex Zhang et al. 2022) TaxID=2831468 RepID=A0A942I2G4_9HYPH|nr:L,D-transpeptidase [Pseudaminobacter soli]MBS3649637.1 L,D-transpeptidase [Pseudaminobacter soli]
MRKVLFAALAICGLSLLGAGTAAAASLVAQVDISNQTMTVLRHGRVLHVWKVSTARDGFVTPRGSWRPTRIHKMWRSRTYDDAPMPYAVFYHGGYAVHGTTAVKALGRPASHGCVRLATPNAAEFYSLVQEVGPGNTQIVVVN